MEQVIGFLVFMGPILLLWWAVCIKGAYNVFKYNSPFGK